MLFDQLDGGMSPAPMDDQVPLTAFETSVREALEHQAAQWDDYPSSWYVFYEGEMGEGQLRLPAPENDEHKHILMITAGCLVALLNMRRVAVALPGRAAVADELPKDNAARQALRRKSSDVMVMTVVDAAMARTHLAPHDLLTRQLKPWLAAPVALLEPGTTPTNTSYDPMAAILQAGLRSSHLIQRSDTGALTGSSTVELTQLVRKLEAAYQQAIQGLT